MNVIERQNSFFTKQTLDRLNDLATRAIQKVQSIPIVDLYTEHSIFRINSKNLLVQYKEFDEGANLIREARYAYDALGRRIEKVVIDLQIPANNKTRRYVYDGEDILKVFDENNQVISKYTHSSLRIDDALAIDDKVNNKSYFFLKDHLGSIFDIVNEDNTFKQHYAYSSFGELQKVTDIGGNDVTANPALEHHFTYTGREYDQESGLYHYRARAYDASIGRFLQVDPDSGDSFDPLTFINKMIYVSNNPMSYVDSKGEFKLRSLIFGGIGYALLRDRFFRDSKFLDRLEKTGIAIVVVAAAFIAAPGAATSALAVTMFQNRNKKGNFFDNLDEITTDFAFNFAISLAANKVFPNNTVATRVSFIRDTASSSVIPSTLLSYSGVLLKESACRSKRKIPKVIVSIFDPVGFIADRGKNDCL